MRFTYGLQVGKMIELSEIIQGEKFIGLADYCYCPDKQDEYGYLKHNEDVNGGIVYTHTHYIPQLFAKLEHLNLANNSVVIVSHNSDHNTPEIKIPDCVGMWWSQNVTFDNPRLRSLPIGLENSRWFRHLEKPKKMLEIASWSHHYRNLLYVNHSISTNPKERQEPYDLFKDKSWATVVHGKNGENFDGYIDDICCHKFILCPDGNGIDTHRLWETLYCGGIPIVKNGINTKFYEKLPITYTNKWSDINEIVLDTIFSEIKYGEHFWNYNLLKFSYWKDQILNG